MNDEINGGYVILPPLITLLPEPDLDEIRSFIPSESSPDELRSFLRRVCVNIHELVRAGRELPPLEPDERAALEIRIAMEMLGD